MSKRNRHIIAAAKAGKTTLCRHVDTERACSEAPVVVLDALRGLDAKTERKLDQAAKQGAKRVLIVINKMDAVDWSPRAFRRVAEAATATLRAAGGPTPVCVPVSALRGVNVHERVRDVLWYHGPSLQEHLAALPEPEQLSERAA